MSEPTVTRKTLRRRIGKALGMKFFSRYAAGEVALTGTPTATTLISSSLTQEDSFWKGGWAWIVDGTYAGSERKITAFTASTDTATLEYALTGAPAAGVLIEIYDTYPASLIHEAINDAISYAGRYFFDSVVDRTLFLRADRLTYTISSLTKRPWQVAKVYAERYETSQTFVPTAITAVGTPQTSVDITAPAGLITADDCFNGWTITYYDGTNAGLSYTVTDTTLSTNKIRVTEATATDNPDTTTYMRLIPPATGENTRTAVELRNLKLDSDEFPDSIYFESIDPELYGCILRIHYNSIPTALTSDSDTTVIPEQFIFHHAVSYLHMSSMNDNRADLARHERLALFHKTRADEFEVKFPKRQQASTIWIEENPSELSGETDPLGWRD